MFILVLGASACGKSEFAENLAVALAAGKEKLYVATMKPFGEDAAFRIARHQALRASKGFDTLECYRDLHHYTPAHGKQYHTVLLECMSTLLSNEFFCNNETVDCHDKIIAGIKHLASQSEYLILISNLVFSCGTQYDETTMQYIYALAALNQSLAQLADGVVTVTCGIPVWSKGKPPATLAE